MLSLFKHFYHTNLNLFHQLPAGFHLSTVKGTEFPVQELPAFFCGTVVPCAMIALMTMLQMPMKMLQMLSVKNLDLQVLLAGEIVVLSSADRKGCQSIWMKLCVHQPPGPNVHSLRHITATMEKI